MADIEDFDLQNARDEPPIERRAERFSRNVRIIQSSLRQIALSLGIPPERLPPAAP